jgi:hypothetical protein
MSVLLYQYTRMVIKMTVVILRYIIVIMYIQNFIIHSCVTVKSTHDEIAGATQGPCWHDRSTADHVCSM